MKSDDKPRTTVTAYVRPINALAWLAAACVLLLPKVASAQIALDARIGFGQGQVSWSRYRPGTWTPVTVYLSGQGPHGVGQLTVKLKRNGHITSYTRKITLHDGPLNESYNFVIDMRPLDESRMAGNNPPEVSAQLVVEGREQAKRKFALPLAVNDETYNILALTKDGSGLNFLATKKLALIHRGVSPARLQNRGNGTVSTAYGALEQVTTSQLLYTDPRALPGMAQGYAMIDAVALADQPLDNLTEDQAAALQAYVRNGGLLIISGGGDLARLKSQFYQEMLPITPESTVVVAETAPELKALTTRYDQPMGLKQGVALTTGAMRPGARVLFGPSGGATKYGLIVERPYGAGSVVFTAFDFLSPEFRGWRQSPSMWRDILRCGNQSISPRTELSNMAHIGNSTGNKSLIDAMAGKQASNSPPFAVVAIFLATYLILLIPASYLLLKKLDKREMAWFTAPGLVLGFSIIAYLIALSLKGAALTANRVVVLETQANSDQVAGYGQTTIYSPRRASYDIAFGGADDTTRGSHAITPAEVLELSPVGLGDLTVENDQDAVIRGAEVRLWDKRSFDCPVITTLGGPVEITTRSVGSGQVHVSIVNKTRYPIQDCALVNNKSQYINVGTLAPGERREVNQPLAWAYRESATSVFLPPAPANWHHVANVNDPKVETPDQVRNELRFALTTALITPNGNNEYQYNNFGSVDQSSTFGRATNALVGWVARPDRPNMEIAIDRKPAMGGEAALLYVHLPPADNFPKRIAAASNPFLQDPILNLKEEAPALGGRLIP